MTDVYECQLEQCHTSLNKIIGQRKLERDHDSTSHDEAKFMFPVLCRVYKAIGIRQVTIPTKHRLGRCK
jgi:hypothetical protein